MEELSEIESIVQSTENSSNQEIPMNSPDQPEEVQALAQPQEYEFNYNGQAIKAPIEKVLRWASMGYGAPQKIGELSKKLQDYEGRVKQFETYDKTYKPIDEWAKQNPDKWQSLVQNWQQAQYGQPQQQGQQPQLPPELIQKIQHFDQKFQEQEQRELVQRQQAADHGLEGEIGSIRKQFSNIDFDAPDERGNSLEYQILQHATDNGIPSFRAAFRDYCFDRLQGMSESKGREKTGLPQKTRDGLLGKQAPTRGQFSPDLRGKNYDQIHEMILAQELGISL